MNVLAIIPARGGSKSIPGKNIALCASKPLVDWTIEAANDSRLVTSAVLSSDSGSILMRARGRVQPQMRPDFLSQDETSTEDVLGYVIERNEPADLYVLLQPTSPLRQAWHIDEAINLLHETGADSVLSVVPSHAYLWSVSASPMYSGRLRRQDMHQFEENGAIYVFTREHWRKTANRLGGHVEMYVMGEEHRIQVDSPLDMEMVNAWLASPRNTWARKLKERAGLVFA